MPYIVPGIEDLKQHLFLVKSDINHYRPERCPHCHGCHLWFHGFYTRQSDRENTGSDSLNPLPIPRFYCKDCGHTFSVLPECIAPRRWYLWRTQEDVLRQALQGNSINAMAKKMRLGRSTITRWISRLKERFLIHADQLKQKYKALGSCVEFIQFWRCCLEQASLAEAMRYLHVSQVAVP